jgi:peptidoglycan/LPS O-acetylase OafA/YrhL
MVARPETGRLMSLDALRGLAALCVMLCHCWELQFFRPEGWQTKVFTWTPLSLILTGRQAVILFFVLSGFVLACSLERWQVYSVFMIRRVCRIYLPFALSIVLSAALYQAIRPEVLPGFTFQPVAWTEPPTVDVLFRHFLMLGTIGSDTLNNVMWSVVYEMRISVIFPLLFLATRRWPVKVLVLATAAHFAISTIWPNNYLFRAATIPQSFLMTAYFVMFFAMGIVLAACRHGLQAAVQSLSPARSGSLGLFGMACLIAPGIGIGRHLPADFVYGVGAMVLIMLAIGQTTWRRVLQSGPLQYLGRISYSLYLSHMVVLVAVAHLFYSTVPNSALVLLIVALSLLAAEASYTFVERPSIWLGRFLTTGGVARAPFPIVPSIATLDPKPRPFEQML